MSTSTQNVYIPGVCNIGPAEIRSRRRSGWIGLIVTVVFIVAVLVFDLPRPYRVFVIIPAGLGATGFLQAALHFCVKFGTQGLFNVDKAVGQTEAVHEAEYRRKDQRKAAIIAFGSLGIAVVIAVVLALIP
jgi:hypothetical protein